jgi:hypothetical protein
MYVQRNSEGVVTGLFQWPNEQASEKGTEEDIAAFHTLAMRKQPSRLDMVVDALMAKGVLLESDMRVQKNGHK